MRGMEREREMEEAKVRGRGGEIHVHVHCIYSEITSGNNLSGFASQFANQKCMHATQILFGTRKSATRNARSRINIDYLTLGSTLTP